MEKHVEKHVDGLRRGIKTYKFCCDLSNYVSSTYNVSCGMTFFPIVSPI